MVSSVGLRDWTKILGEEDPRKQVEELKKKIREAEEEKQVAEEVNTQLKRKREEVREREDMMRGSSAGGLAGKAMGSAMYVELRVRRVAAEVERKKLRRRAETARMTAAGTAVRVERLNLQGVSGDHGGSSYFNSGHRRDGNNFPGGV